jgi:transposase
LLGVSERTFRRQIGRFEADGMQGLIDRRMGQVSSRRAPVDEVLGVQRVYSAGFVGWNVKHFHAWYEREHGGRRSYSWVKNLLQEAKLVVRAKARGRHRLKRDRRPLPGMMLHQDASSHEWVPGRRWDLVVTMDDATSEHTSMFFCAEEGTDSSFHGIGQTIARHDLSCSLYTDCHAITQFAIDNRLTGRLAPSANECSAPLRSLGAWRDLWQACRDLW